MIDLVPCFQNAFQNATKVNETVFLGLLRSTLDLAGQ